MVGIHVVGSAATHPEMIWATFEHFGNTPNAAYQYIDNTNTTKTVAQNTAGNWLFSMPGSAGPFNNAHASMVPHTPNIAPVSPYTINPSDTIRLKPFGGAYNITPNQVDATTAASNSEIIAVNNSVLGQLIGGDVRGNYYMVGSTWTMKGASPSGSYSGSGGAGNEVGTSQLSNTTMETYQQGPDSQWNQYTNCFSCHQTNTTSVSHIFNHVKPLFP